MFLISEVFLVILSVCFSWFFENALLRSLEEPQETKQSDVQNSYFLNLPHNVLVHISSLLSDDDIRQLYKVGKALEPPIQEAISRRPIFIRNQFECDWVEEIFKGSLAKVKRVRIQSPIKLGQEIQDHHWLQKLPVSINELSLELRISDDSNKAFDALVEDLLACSERSTCPLESLNLSVNLKFLDQNKITSIQQLGQLNRLKNLKLLNCDGTELDEKVLASVLTKLTALTHLNLEYTGIFESEATALGPALGRLVTLRHLNLGWTAIKSTGARNLAPVIGDLTALMHLDLRDNDLDAAGASELAPAFRKLTYLTHLNLGRNNIGADGVSALAPALRALTNLTHLNLERNNIGADGASALAPIIGELPTLVEYRFE